MTFIADLHIHSKYSRATSKDMSPESIWRWAQLKGISVIGTGDFTHPEWFKELNDKIEPTGNGLFRLKREFITNNIPDSCRSDIFFMLTAEVSCIYRKNGKTRKIHSILLVPDFATAIKINKSLSKIGNLNADGRPILGLDAKKLLEIVLDSSPEGMLVPAHAWTPHFSILGSESGFDSINECFEELTPFIYAIETGLSSDPPMNWRLSALDNITLISNSDAHSPNKIGREANIFDTDISYKGIVEAIKTRRGFSGTIEFFPEEGKYYYDGHRACGICLSPKETIRHNYLCPICGERVTVGVMHRVEKLADRDEDFRPKDSFFFYSIIPLTEIISEALKVNSNSKAVDRKYQNLLQELGNEFKILMDVSIEDIKKVESDNIISEAIEKMRKGDVHISPGYDGEYGRISIFGH
jgi:uncharacterized protein (TIGR00375 family)